MDLRSYISGISFRAIEPPLPLGPDRRLRIPRPGQDAKLLELPGSPLDIFNCALPEAEDVTRGVLAPTREIPRMSTFAVGAVLNCAVAAMPADQVYVNVGVWEGFTFFTGALGNLDKRCIGVDNFSEWAMEEVRVSLVDRLERIGTPSQTLHVMDYREYFRDVHREPIGVYVYDGDHAYEHQLHGLQIAEPFLADGCVIVVDDTNWRNPHQATFDFMERSERTWEVLLDCDTSSPGHPTWWNGLVVIKDVTGATGADLATNDAAHASPKARVPKPPDFVAEPLRSDGPSVSLIVRNDGRDEQALRRVIEEALDQRWPFTEVLVADEHPGERGAAVLESFGDRIAVVSPNGAGAVRAAIAQCGGEFVGFVDTDATLRPSAVEVGLAFPRPARFNTGLSPERHAEIERSIAG